MRYHISVDSIKNKDIPTGMLGESIACLYLKNLGYRVITRNFLRKCGEIDIVAEKDGRLHFVEVKTVSHEIVVGGVQSWNPIDNLHEEKIRRIHRTVYTYLSAFHVNQEDWQIDAVLIVLDRKNKEAYIEVLEAIG